MNKDSSLCLTSLPDDLIAMCYAGLPASDLVMLESVSPRLRALIATDSVCWKRCVETRWAKVSSNLVVLPAAARHAGSWKALYAEKIAADAKNISWFVISTSETMAVVDAVTSLDRASRPLQVPLHSPWHSGNPTGVTNSTSGNGAAPGSSSMMGDGEPCSPPTNNSMVANELLSSNANVGASSAATVAAVPSASVMKLGVGVGASSPVSVMQEGPQVLSVVLLIDASSSVTQEDFCCMKLFATSLVTALRDAAAGEAHIALIQFNDRPNVELPLTAASMPKVTSTIDTMKQLTGSTDIAAPIRRARQMLTEEAPPGDRVIALLTDGQTHADELRASEREARAAADEANARIFTLGVGRDIDESGLTRVASATPGGMYFTLRRYIPAK